MDCELRCQPTGLRVVAHAHPPTPTHHPPLQAQHHTPRLSTHSGTRQLLGVNVHSILRYAPLTRGYLGWLRGANPFAPWTYVDLPTDPPPDG